jgi:hypothetical protein
LGVSDDLSTFMSPQLVDLARLGHALGCRCSYNIIA